MLLVRFSKCIWMKSEALFKVIYIHSLCLNYCYISILIGKYFYIEEKWCLYVGNPHSNVNWTEILDSHLVRDF